MTFECWKKERKPRWAHNLWEVFWPKSHSPHFVEPMRRVDVWQRYLRGWNNWSGPKKKVKSRRVKSDCKVTETNTHVTSWMLCRWCDYAPQTPWTTIWCELMYVSARKITCEVFPVYTPVGYSGLYRLQPKSLQHKIKSQLRSLHLRITILSTPIDHSATCSNKKVSRIASLFSCRLELLLCMFLTTYCLVALGLDLVVGLVFWFSSDCRYR